MTSRIRIICIIIVAALLSCSIFADDWTQWRGPEGRGISYETGWNPEALNPSPEIRWQKNIGRGHGHVTVRGRNLYVQGDHWTAIGTDTLVENSVYCLDTGSGNEIWQYTYEGKNRPYAGPRTAPVLDEERLYTLGPEGTLHCLNAENGNVVWKKQLNEDFGVKIPYWGFSGSPVIDGDLMILTAGKSGLALNKRTGVKVWGDSLDQECSLASPVLCNLNGKRAALITGGGRLHAVQVKDGKALWSFDWNSDMDPVVTGNQIFVWSNEEGSAHLSLENGQPITVWREKKLKGLFQGFRVYQDHAYGFGSIRRNMPLCCIDINRGVLNWKEDFGQWGDVLIADGKLVIVTGTGELIIADTNPENLNIISRAKVIDVPVDESLPNPQRCYLWTMPVLANGSIYLRNTYGDLVCVEVAKKAL